MDEAFIVSENRELEEYIATKLSKCENEWKEIEINTTSSFYKSFRIVPKPVKISNTNCKVSLQFNLYFIMINECIVQ